jgi:integrase
MVTQMDERVELDSLAAFHRRRDGRDDLPALPLRPLIAEYTATFGSTWRPVTRRKHADDFARVIAWLEANGLAVTTASLDFPTLVDYVGYLRIRPKVSGVWRGGADALGRSLRLRTPAQTLSANSVNAYVRPLRSLVIWLVDEGLLACDPFRRSRRRAALNPLLPSEETPTKSATLDDIRALEAGCAGDRALDLRDRAIVSILKTTAARNSGVRLLRLEDLDFERALIRFRRGKGGKTLDVALQPETRAALLAYLERGRPILVEQACADGEAHPGWRGRRDLADVRLPPDPARHRDPAGQQRDATRRGQSVSGPFLDRCDSPLRSPDPRCARAAGGRRPRTVGARGDPLRSAIPQSLCRSVSLRNASSTVDQLPLQGEP